MAKSIKLKNLYSTKKSLEMNPNETKGFGDPEQGMGDETCPTCGMDRKDWTQPQGYDLGGESYCCEGCAEGTGCICMEESKNKRSA